MTQQPFPPSGGDPWSAPAKPGDSVYPALKQLSGRLLVVEPQTLEENVPDTYNPGKTKDRMTVDLTFLDGDTLTVALDRNDVATPLPKPIQAGETISGLYVSQSVLITQLKQAMRDRGGSGMVLGRLGKGEARNGNNAPWILVAASEQDNESARRWYAWRQQQQASAALQPPAQAAPPVQQQPVQQAPQQQAAPTPQQQAPVYTTPPVTTPQQAQPAPWGQQAPAQPVAQGGPAIDPRPAF